MYALIPWLMATIFDMYVLRCAESVDLGLSILARRPVIVANGGNTLPLVESLQRGLAPIECFVLREVIRAVNKLQQGLVLRSDETTLDPVADKLS